MEDDADLREQLFHNTVRENIVSFLIQKSQNKKKVFFLFSCIYFKFLFVKQIANYRVFTLNWLLNWHCFVFALLCFEFVWTLHCNLVYSKLVNIIWRRKEKQIIIVFSRRVYGTIFSNWIKIREIKLTLIICFQLQVLVIEEKFDYKN